MFTVNVYVYVNVYCFGVWFTVENIYFNYVILSAIILVIS